MPLALNVERWIGSNIFRSGLRILHPDVLNVCIRVVENVLAKMKMQTYVSGHQLW
jgi:hypothetical protein